MTPTQNQAVWELCRQGMHRIAEDAEHAWQQGQRFIPDGQCQVAREIDHLIETCNWEVGAQRLTQTP